MLASLFILAAIWFGPTLGHIHSQKITGLDREQLSLSTWILCVTSAAAVPADVSLNAVSQTKKESELDEYDGSTDNEFGKFICRDRTICSIA